MPQALPRGDLLRTLIIPLLLALVLMADMVTPIGLAIWIFYLLPVCLCVFVDRPAMPLWTAGLATVLIGVGYLVSPAGGNPTTAVINRASGAVVIWFLSVAVYRYIVAQTQMRRFAWLQEAHVTVVQQTRRLQTPAEVAGALLRAVVPQAQAQVGVVYRLGAQRVILGHQIVGHVANGAGAGHGRHDDAIGQCEGPEGERSKQDGHVRFSLL